MTINVYKNKAFCIRCGLKIKFRWWHPRPKQVREFTAIHDTIVRLRQEAYADKNVKLNGCGMITSKQSKGKKK